MPSRNYVGRGKVIGQYGNIKIGMKLEDLQKIANERGWVNLIVSETREPDKYGNTHTVYEDDFVPNRGGNSKARGSSSSGKDDLPF